MKKLTFVMLAALTLSLFALPGSALGAFDIPMAQTAPAIDGVYDAAEWAGAWHVLLDAKNPQFTQTANSISETYYPTWDFYVMWDPDNFYFAVVCKGDMTPTPKKMESGMDTRDNTIRGDGIQLFINPSGDYSQNSGKDAADATYGAAFIWTDFYCEYADGVTPFTWAYDPFDGDKIDAMPDCMKQYVIGASRSGDSYVIECMAPWKALNGTAAGGSDQWKMTFPRKTGDKVVFDFHTLDFDGTGNQCRYGITPDGTAPAAGSGSLDQFSQFTLVGDLAGKAPVVETSAAETASASGTVTTSSPATGDAAILSASFLALTAAAMAFYAKKKSGK